MQVQIALLVRYQALLVLARHLGESPCPGS